MIMIEIREVLSNSDLNAFIKFPDKLYKHNKYRATPLHSFERALLNKKKNPAFEYCEAKYWLAYSNGKIVGRIAGIINHRFIELWGKKYARFGWIDFIEDETISQALLQEVEEWAISKGMDGIQGPLGFTDMDMEGMLVEGFEEEGTMAVLYNYPYYPEHMEKHGYQKDADWVQREIKIPESVPERLDKFAEIVSKKYKVRPLKAEKAKDLLPYAKSMFESLNDSFKQLYGFVPLTEKQIQHYTKDYFSIILPEYVCFVLNEDDDVIGFGVAMPSLTQALIKSRGNLIPCGAYHILRTLKKHDIMDLYLNGVRPDYQNKGIHAIYFTELMKSFIKNKISFAITNPQLEDNNRALMLWEGYEQRVHIRRRSYIKLFTN